MEQLFDFEDSFDFTQEEKSALLQWFSTFDCIDEPIEQYTQLTSGTYLHKICQEA